MPICKCGFKYREELHSCPLCGASDRQPARGVGLPNTGRDSGLQRKSRIKRGKRPNPIGKGKKRRLDKGGSEMKVFIEIWRARKHTCQNRACCQELKTFHPAQFHHIKSKGAHPALRLDPENIALVCRACHDLAHAKGNSALSLPENPAG